MGDSSSGFALQVSLQYVKNVLAPFIVGGGAILSFPWRWSALGCGTAAAAWAMYIAADGSEFHGEGKHDPQFSKHDWLLASMRKYLRLTLHRTAEVQEQLVAKSSTGVGQAVFGVFPHGVNADFRAMLDSMMLEAFSKVAPARTLAATILFRIPGVRSYSLKTGAVDAGRKTAKRVLNKGLSMLVLPGGLDEQLLTEHGKEKIFVQKRFGFVKLAIEHGVPLVPVYVFGCTDLYFTSNFLVKLRLWIAKVFRIALPIYWGNWGFWAYPMPNGFPMPVQQNVVFGDPIEVQKNEKPTNEEVAAVHAKFVVALKELFDAHKGKFGCSDRALVVL